MRHAVYHEVRIAAVTREREHETCINDNIPTHQKETAHTHHANWMYCGCLGFKVVEVKLPRVCRCVSGSEGGPAHCVCYGLCDGWVDAWVTGDVHIVFVPASAICAMAW